MKCYIYVPIKKEYEIEYEIDGDKAILYDDAGKVHRKLPLNKFNQEYSSTKELALIKYYLFTKKEQLKQIEKFKKNIEAREKTIDRLNTEFGHLVDLYPEEFI